MARTLLLTTVCALLMGLATATVGWDNCTKNFVNGFQPVGPANSVKICRDGAIAISYDADMIDPAFSAYYVTSAQAQHPIEGRDDFYLDPDLETLGVKQAHPYSRAFNKTWNKGHLAPNHLLSYSLDSKHACFTMANVAPQGGYFNQHPWEELEDHTLKWIAAHNALHIVTGVAYKDRSHVQYSEEGIAVPDYYFKILCDASAGQSVGFIGPNTPENKAAPNIVSVQDVENVFGGQLFPSTCNTTTFDESYWWTEAPSAFLRV